MQVAFIPLLFQTFFCLIDLLQMQDCLNQYWGDITTKTVYTTSGIYINIVTKCFTSIYRLWHLLIICGWIFPFKSHRYFVCVWQVCYHWKTHLISFMHQRDSWRPPSFMIKDPKTPPSPPSHPPKSQPYSSVHSRP